MIYDKASLVQIPSGYKSGTLYSVVPNTADGDFDVTRGSTATRVNKDGLIESTAANQARLSRNFIDGVVQPDPYLLLEPARANLIVRSETFNLWGDVGVTVTEDATIAPTGAQTADLLTSTANNWRRSISYTITNGTVYSFSCFVKKHTTTDNIRFELYKGASATFLDFVFSTQALSASDTSLTDLKVENYPNDWYRVSCKFTSNGTNFICYAYPSQGYGTSGSAYFWGAQLEQGTHPTSYIPTSGSAVTRTADLVSGGGDANLFNDSEGTLFVEARGLDSNDTSPRGINISSGNNENRVLIQWQGNTLYFVVLKFYFNQTLISTTAYDTEEYLRIGFRYKENDVAVYVNGNLVAIDTNASMFSDGTLTTLDFRIGTLGSDNYFNGGVKQLMYFNTALLNSELEEITSYKSFGQMAKALLYTIE